MSIERGGFSFKNNINYSPVKIIPEGWGNVFVHYEPNNWQRTTPVIDSGIPDHGAQGAITLQIGKEKPTTIPKGEVTVPDGATVTCTYFTKNDPKGMQPITIELYRNGSSPTVFDPNKNTTEEKKFSLESQSVLTGEEFPNPLEPKMKVWEEKNPTYITQSQVEEILGFNVSMLIKKGFIHPRYHDHKGTIKEFTMHDVLRAFLIKTVKTENHLVFWSQIRSSTVTPFTEKNVQYLREQSDWPELVKRGKTFGIDVEQYADSLLKNMSR
ncbi:MAG: hypothetical protein WAV51_00735 [Microgenomates group bacterium]